MWFRSGRESAAAGFSGWTVDEAAVLTSSYTRGGVAGADRFVFSGNEV
jgi:hypothetical protein